MRLVDLTDERLRARANAKWSVALEGVLPAWVAEMDFALAEPIADALHEGIDLGAVGYGTKDRQSGVPEALAAFAERRWSWVIDPDRVVLTGDVMGGVELVLRTLCADAPVLVPTPAYPPFLDVVPLTGRRMVPVPLDADAPRATLDLDRIGAALEDGARTVLLCQPHNPWGRAFHRDELEGLRDLVSCHRAQVISDEVHAPLVLPGARHLPYASIEGTPGHTTTVISAAKAWNVPGLKCAQIIAGTDSNASALRSLPLVANHGSAPLGIIAARVAYLQGEPWLDALLTRLDDNRALFTDLVTTHLPLARMRPLEATYLAWLDVRAYSRSPAAAARDRGRVLVSDGATFGPGGQGHIRVNLATSPERVEEVVRRLVRAFASHGD